MDVALWQKQSQDSISEYSDIRWLPRILPRATMLHRDNIIDTLFIWSTEVSLFVENRMMIHSECYQFTFARKLPDRISTPGSLNMVLDLVASTPPKQFSLNTIRIHREGD